MEPPPLVNSDLLTRIRTEVTPQFLKKLLLHTNERVKGKFWRGVWNGPVPGGKLAEDFVHDALRDVMFGKRQWNPETVPDFYRFLCGVVDSKISHLAQRQENIREERSPALATESEPDFFDSLRHEGVALPCDEVITKEIEESNERLFFELLDYVADDPLLQKLLSCIFDGIEGRAEKASALGVTPDEVTHAQKRLERRLPDFAKKFAHLNPFKPR